MKRPRLSAVETLPNYRLKLTFINDAVYIVSLAEELKKHPRLKLIADPAAFSKAALVAGEGWTVEWPEQDIQIGADTLWLDAQAQNAPDENTRIFILWRLKHGLSLAESAKALGMTARTMSAYGSGKRPVPRYVALACKGWDAEQLLNQGLDAG
jgi:hypothetical protein